jgi:transcriptional regulator with XRE-family HTH domain
VNVSNTHGARVDPSWWLGPELQDALANRDIGAIFRFLRGRGFSQTRIAALTGQNQSEVSAILAHGRQVTAYDVLARIADGLTIPRGLMGLAYVAPVAAIRDGADATEGRHMRRRTFMGVAAKITMGATLAAGDLAILATPVAAAPHPGHIGLGDVQRIEDMTAALDRQDLAFGGGACREAIVGYLNWATGLRDTAMTDEVRLALDTALAHLEELAGWTSYDLLLLDSAEHFYLRALHSARLAEYPFMAAKALARLAEIYAVEGQYGDAMRMAQLATIPAREAGSARMSAFLHLLDAGVYARLGDAKATGTAVSRARDDYANADDAAPARQTRFLIDSTFNHYISMAHSRLAEHDPAYAAHAIEAASTAAGLTPTGEIRSWLVDATPLALNAYRAGDTALANQTTSRIVAALPQVSSRRVLARLRPLTAEATTHDSTATDLAHQLDTRPSTEQPR